MNQRSICSTHRKNRRYRAVLPVGLMLTVLVSVALSGPQAGGQATPEKPAAQTAETSGQERITFFVLGDTQGHEDFLHTLVARIAAEKPDFVLIPGDCCMANGADPKPWDKFFSIFAPLYREPNTMLYAIPGNHDMDGDFTAAMKQWQARWDLPNAKLYYSFVKKDSVYVAGLFVTNFSLFRTLKQPPHLESLQWPYPAVDTQKSQIEWLRDELKSIPANIKWKIIFHHEPGARYARLSSPTHGMADPGVSVYVEPMAFDAGVDLIIRGHHHFYERTYPINTRTGRRDDAKGVTMITSGGGVSGFNPPNPDDARPSWFDAVISLNRIHYCKAVIEGNRLSWEAIDLDGDVFDRFEIIKSPDGRRKWIGLPQKARFLTGK
ncbi:MAG: metallophosphoesterase [Armatimonadetes bacterium]|nr:metallophosphoesterase [Armatimonadota bacterium]